MLYDAFRDIDLGALIRFRIDGNVFNLRRLNSKTRISKVLFRDLLFADDCALLAHTVGDIKAIANFLFFSFILSHFYVGSMYDDIRLHVARSYTSSADSPFSLMSSFTLSNHLLLGLPLFLLPCTFITIALLPT